MNLRLIPVIAITCLFFNAPKLGAQTAESKLAALEKLPPQERQQRLLDGAKAEGEALVYANMPVSTSPALRLLLASIRKAGPAMRLRMSF